MRGLTLNNMLDCWKEQKPIWLLVIAAVLLLLVIIILVVFLQARSSDVEETKGMVRRSSMQKHSILSFV